MKPADLPTRARAQHIHNPLPMMIMPFIGSFLTCGGVPGNIFTQLNDLALKTTVCSARFKNIGLSVYVRGSTGSQLNSTNSLVISYHYYYFFITRSCWQTPTTVSGASAGRRRKPEPGAAVAGLTLGLRTSLASSSWWSCRNLQWPVGGLRKARQPAEVVLLVLILLLKQMTFRLQREATAANH